MNITCSLLTLPSQVLGVLAIAVAAGQCSAQPVPTNLGPAIVIAQLNSANSLGQQQTVGTTPGTYTATLPNTVGTASSTIILGSDPTVTAGAENYGIWLVSPNNQYLNDGGIATATVGYSFEYVSSATSPVPIHITLQATAAVTPGSEALGGSAYAIFNLVGPNQNVTYSDVVGGTSPTNTFPTTHSIPFVMSPNAVYSIHMTAGALPAGLSSPTQSPIPGTAFAQIDPTIAVDSSYSDSSGYFIFSEGVTAAAVPEPASSFLLLIGACLVAIRVNAVRKWTRLA